MALANSNSIGPITPPPVYVTAAPPPFGTGPWRVTDVYAMGPLAEPWGCVRDGRGSIVARLPWAQALELVRLLDGESSPPPMPYSDVVSTSPRCPRCGRDWTDTGCLTPSVHGSVQYSAR